MSMTTRQNAESLIQQQLINTIQQDAPKQSVFMRLGRKLSNMTSNQTRMPVLDMLPMAYWVSGDTGYKQTTQQAWDNVFLDAEELAVIVPIPEAVVADASFDIMGQIKPRVIEAIAQRVDSAILFGVNKPSAWRADIITTARQAGNNVAGSSIGYDTLLGTDGVLAKLEAQGYAADAAIAAMAMKAKLRSIKDDVNAPLFVTNMQGATPYALDGVPVLFPDNGSFDSSIAQMIVGDFKRAVYAIRQDITVKILDQGVIQDPSDKTIVYNLAQQDMIALRVVFRMGWALPNPATRLDENRVGCPFAYIEPSTAVTTQTATFTVQDSSSNAIADAFVEVNDARLKTNASGQCVFNLRAGTYKVKVKKSGYTTANDSITVASSSVTKTVTLATA